MFGTESAYSPRTMNAEEHIEKSGTIDLEPSNADSKRQIKILAKTVYRQLRSTGCSQREVVAFTSELLDLMTADIRGETNGAVKSRTQ